MSSIYQKGNKFLIRQIILGILNFGFSLSIIYILIFSLINRGTIPIEYVWFSVLIFMLGFFSLIISISTEIPEDKETLFYVLSYLSGKIMLALFFVVIIIGMIIVDILNAVG